MGRCSTKKRRAAHSGLKGPAILRVNNDTLNECDRKHRGGGGSVAPMLRCSHGNLEWLGSGDWTTVATAGRGSDVARGRLRRRW